MFFIKDFKNYYGRDVKGDNSAYKARKSEKQHIAIFSNFFSSTSGNLFFTNEMYSTFKDAVLASIGICNVKDKIVLDVFETQTSDEETREMLTIGFKRYITALYNYHRRFYLKQLVQVSLFAVIGVLLIYSIFRLNLGFPDWVNFCIETAGTVLVWQFVGYFSFEYSGQKRELLRLNQIKNIEYSFRHWE